MRQEQQAPAAEGLWSAYSTRPSQRLREQIVEQYRHLALSLLKRMGHGGDEDLQQVALLSLVKAIDRFDPTSGFRFSTFATPTIMGEIKRYLRDHSRLVRPPRSLHDLHAALLAKDRELTALAGSPPTLAEIADALGVSLEQAVEAMAIEDICAPCSLSALIPAAGDPASPLDDYLGAVDAAIERVVTGVAWRQVLEGLDPLLKQIIEMRYYQQLTQREAARELGISQMQVSRLERRAIEWLRRQAATIGNMEEVPLPQELVPSPSTGATSA